MKSLSLMIAVALAAAPAWSQGPHAVVGKAATSVAQAAARLRAASFPARSIATVRLAAPASARVKSLAQDDKRERVGFARDAVRESDGPAPSPSWIALPGGGHATRLGLVSPGAASLRLSLR